MDNRHKCYQCKNKFSTSRKLNPVEIKNIQKSNIQIKSNLVNLYFCESYCSIICKNKAINEAKLIIAKLEKENRANDRNVPIANTTNHLRTLPCKYCNIASTGEQVKQSIHDYDCMRRENTNFRYLWKPGYRPCPKCNGTGIEEGSRDCGEVCYVCKGDRFYPCNMCDGKSTK